MEIRCNMLVMAKQRALVIFEWMDSQRSAKDF
jgi:hypothetical protein